MLARLLAHTSCWHRQALTPLEASCWHVLQVLQRIRGVPNVEVEYADIVEAARQSNLIKNPYGQPLTKPLSTTLHLKPRVHRGSNPWNGASLTDAVAAGNLMKRKYRPQLVTAVVFMIFQQFDGINAIIFCKLRWPFASYTWRCIALAILDSAKY